MAPAWLPAVARGFHGDKDGNIERDAFRGLSLMTPVLLKPSEASGMRQLEAPRLLVPHSSLDVEEFCQHSTASPAGSQVRW